MQLTPYGSFEHIKESIVQYLETQYRISHPKIFEERGEILRRDGVVAQQPFIEATPSFPTANKLSVLEDMYPQFIPQGISELVRHGIPIDKYDLYTLQEEAILAAFSDKPSLLVATGTGSGKTEAFLLPILSDILNEAKTWNAPRARQERGRYDAANNIWLDTRRHETRPAALRSIILYPMNALVNDQLSRLRRILALNDSPEWQRRNLNGNVIHFGMYTSLCQPTGNWTDKWRRDKFTHHMEKIDKDWQYLKENMRETGFWPRPDSPEMLCRWDMQVAPPDIMVTNYSMLEYMLVRPIENEIFEITKKWIHDNDDARFTLVLDEAHTYTGAKGTEVAHLVRRLKERLGIEPGSDKFRAIATTASLPDDPEAKTNLYNFMEDLTGEPKSKFTLITLPKSINELPDRTPTEKALYAFADFYGNFSVVKPEDAIEKIAEDLELGKVDKTLNPQIALYRLLEGNEDIIWVRQRTARNSTLLSDLANECWGELGDEELREWATAGIISAGSYARPQDTTDIPPLLSVRLHLFFRGISGLWACMDPNCSKVPEHLRSEDRPVGKIYTEPRPWCECGARVLELFSCRSCGLLFLGGIPDEQEHSLWPWSDDLSGERQDINDFRIFGVEPPHPEIQAEYRSTTSTLFCHQNEPTARKVWEVGHTENNQGEMVSPFPEKCPRCQKYTGSFWGNREVIEPLRTKGPQSFSLIVEDGFRVQPRATNAEPPNYGRKALLFSDSRQEAAKLAGDLRTDHTKDLFRQLLYKALHTCSTCNGKGEIEELREAYRIGQEPDTIRKVCPQCNGNGYSDDPDPADYKTIRSRVIDAQFSRGINPTTDMFEGFFSDLESGSPTVYSRAEEYFNVALRRELSEKDFALEPLGLGNWKVNLPNEIGSFDKLTEEESRIFLQSVARILSTENILLPPEPIDPWDWNKKLVEEYERQVIIPGFRKEGQAIPYNLEHYRKLGRYVIAVSKELVASGRLNDENEANYWRDDLYWPLWNALINFNVLSWAGAKIKDKVPYGIRIDMFELHPIKDKVYRCKACGYIMAETLFGVCIRCGQKAELIDPKEIKNYYRREALFVEPDSNFEDPFPLRAIEHTAQIPGAEARDLERWFQDLFHENQHPLDHRIDVLSVTTTMEMGIDIGSLLCVGLRNVPPNVANYQQRAGRAGRRGSSLATVLAYAQQRSHDQYYFSRPPEIVTSPPKVPSLYIQNEVIARRHFRSLAMQDFFCKQQIGSTRRGLFGSWGKISDFVNRQYSDKMTSHFSVNKAILINRGKKIIDTNFHEKLEEWLIAIPSEIQQIIQYENGKSDLFSCLINAGLLPKYAFPVDVVSLAIPDIGRRENNNGNGSNRTYWYEQDDDSMQRDLKIALAEYAPGSEVIRGEFPKTYIYKSAGLYDAYNSKPNYRPEEKLIECQDCSSIEIVPVDSPPVTQCKECGSYDILALPFVRPPGFTVDRALPRAGAEDYTGGGRETSGYVAPARLLVGKTSFSGGEPQTPFAPNLYAYVRVGDLFLSNKGPDPRNFPGFIICPECGRALDPDNLGTHTYPNNIPPFWGKNQGPKKGTRCPNRTDFTNQVLLGYKFHSEVILLGVDLPQDLDASFYDPSGRAVWYSYGTLVANAAAIVLQVDPGELKVGIRAVKRAPERIHGEIFLYDDVPGGAGYARAILENLEEILRKALEIGQHCPNPECDGACYQCMYDYRNQALHPLLDRYLGTAVLEYVLDGKKPKISDKKAAKCASMLEAYAKAKYKVEPGVNVEGVQLASILENKAGDRIGLWVIHPLEAKPKPEIKQRILAQHKIRCAVHNSFDLERRPFWVLNHLI